MEFNIRFYTLCLFLREHSFRSLLSHFCDSTHSSGPSQVIWITRISPHQAAYGRKRWENAGEGREVLSGGTGEAVGKSWS